MCLFGLACSSQAAQISDKSKKPDGYMICGSLSQQPYTAFNEASSRCLSRAKQLVSTYATNLSSIKDNFILSLQQANAINSQKCITAYKASVANVPCSLLRFQSQLLMQEADSIRIENSLAKKCREAFIQNGLIPNQSNFLSREQEINCPQAFVRNYYINEEVIVNTDFYLSIADGCLEHNKAIVMSFANEVNALEQAYKTQSKDIISTDIVETELIFLKDFIKSTKAKHDNLKEFIDVTNKIEKLESIWFRGSEKNDELGLLYYRQQIVLGSIKKLFGKEFVSCLTENKKEIHLKANSEIDKCKNLLSHSEAELIRLSALVSYVQKCKEEYQLAETAKVRSIYQKFVDTGFADEESKKIFEALQTDSILKDRVAYHITIHSNFTEAGQELLKHYDITPEKFQSFTGNALQRYLSERLCNIVNHSGQIFLENRNNEIVCAYVEATAQTCAVASDLVRAGNTQQAIAMTNLADVLNQASNVAVGILKGVATGVIDNYAGIVDIIRHPTHIVEQLKQVGGFFVGLAKRDAALLAKIEQACDLFSRLPVEQQAEHVAALLTVFIVPGPGKVKSLLGMDKALKSINRVIKIEAAALKALYDIEKMGMTVINGVSVPDHLVDMVHQLRKAGKIATDNDIKTWVEHLKSPVFSSWKHAIEDMSEQITRAKTSQAFSKASEASSLLHMTEDIAKGIWAQSIELSELRQVVDNLKNKVSNISPGTYLNKMSNDIPRLEKIAEEMYETFRKMNDDVLQISQNTGIPKSIINRIKEHVFHEKHILHDGIGRFQADFDMAHSWKRLIEGSFVQTDLCLLLHEFSESLIMQGEKISWRVAHDIVDKSFPWVTLL